MLTKLNNIYASWFGLGYIPKAPGTWGSIGGLMLVYIIFMSWHMYYGSTISVINYCSFTAALFLLGILSANKFDKDNRTHDSKMIVIDEVVGIMITCLPMIWLSAVHNAPIAFGGWIQPLIALILFRFFDILKPWPISYIDKKVGDGLGVMLDDVLAGIAAAFCFTLIGYSYHEFIQTR